MDGSGLDIRFLEHWQGFCQRANHRSGDENDLGEIEMINTETRLYGIIGNPIRHSLSPIIHNHAFRRMGWNGVFLAFDVADLEEALRGIRGLGIRGVSVTLPFKISVIPYLDQVDPMAERIKAVNTIVNDGERLIGYNTDGYGALKALEEKVDLRGRRVCLIGAGGAARAIGFGLTQRGCQVSILNRSPDRAAQLAKALGCDHGPLSFPQIHTDRMEADRWSADVLINATSVGMHPHDGESPVPKGVLKKGMTVMDIVYRPLRTRLLREAEEQGCQTIDGLEMLAYQGAAQLEIWTGTRPDVQQVKEDLRRAVEG